MQIAPGVCIGSFVWRSDERSGSAAKRASALIELSRKASRLAVVPRARHRVQELPRHLGELIGVAARAKDPGESARREFPVSVKVEQERVVVGVGASHVIVFGPGHCIGWRMFRNPPPSGVNPQLTNAARWQLASLTEIFACPRSSLGDAPNDERMTSLNRRTLPKPDACATRVIGNDGVSRRRRAK